MIDLNLKTDPKLPYHYIIGVAIENAKSKTPGKLYLKYGPLFFTNDDVKKMQLGQQLSDDHIYKKIYKMTNNEIYKMTDCLTLITMFSGLFIASKINDASIHHFSCNFKHDDMNTFFTNMVCFANDIESMDRQQLNRAKIHY